MVDCKGYVRSLMTDLNVRPALLIELGVALALFLLASVGGCVMHRCGERLRTEKIRQNEEQSMMLAKKTHAVRCEALALERLKNTIGEEALCELFARHAGDRFYSDGLNCFLDRFERLVQPFSTDTLYSSDIDDKRKDLIDRYVAAKDELARARNNASDSKDEFETYDEYKKRRKNEKGEIGRLEQKVDKISDEIVWLEEVSNPHVALRAITGIYDMDEALIFVPKTDWFYNAEKRIFSVFARHKERPKNEWLVSRDPDWEDYRGVFQSFNFSVNGIPISQFVQSVGINYSYTSTLENWGHPSAFKKYKERNPFLLVHLGRCEFKVQNGENRIVIMPWANHGKDIVEDGETGNETYEDKYVREMYRLDDKPWNERILREFEISAQSNAASLIKVSLSGGGEKGHYDSLPHVGVFADYETAGGREEIERVLQHFEKIGGPYYREFCKQVRILMVQETK